jgi:KipI family sensor histidine kinase inhibitor
MTKTPLTSAPDAGFPRIDPVGLGGLLVRFGESLSEAANRAALAFRAQVERESWEGVEECTTSLVSACLLFDPLAVGPEALTARAMALLHSRDWYAEPLPEGRRFITIPTCYAPKHAPQLAEAAELAGLSVEAAVASLSGARVRVTALGFAPGQPYLATLPEAWDIPRQAGLTPKVPKGALVVAIRQFVLFSVSAPTGWRHIGQTAVPLFDEASSDPFFLRAGDEVQFAAVSADDFEPLRLAPDGGARAVPL